MEKTVHSLSGLVPEPRLVKTSMGPAFRYEERLPEQAVVLKVARLVSTLRATRVLLDLGFVQEVGTLERVIDELHENVFFIVTGHANPSPRYQKFMDDFWAEEFDADTALASTQKRGMTPRQKIQAEISRILSDVPGSDADPCRMAEQLRTVEKAQSGYVHGAAPQLMEMFGARPPRFHMNGMLGTIREREHREQFWHDVYRSICVFVLVTHAFEDSARAAKIRAYLDEFEQSKPGNGRGSEGDPAGPG